MKFVPGLSRNYFSRGSPRRPAKPLRPPQAALRLVAELLEDRTLLSAGFGTQLLPRLSGGGPLEGLVRQATPSQNVVDGAGPGSVSPNSGHGYPVPQATAAAGVQVNLGAAAQPVSVLAPPAGAAATFADALTPTLSTSVAAQATTSTSVVSLQSVFPSAVSASVNTAPTNSGSFAAATVPGTSAAITASTASTVPASSTFHLPAFVDAGAARLGSGTMLAMAGTGTAAWGVRADSSTNLGVFPLTTAARPGLSTVSAAPGHTMTRVETMTEARLQKEALLTAWEMGAVSTPVSEAQPPAVQGRVVVGEDRIEALTGLVPMDHVFAQAVVPGTPNLADGLNTLDTHEGGGTQGAASARLDVVVLGSLLAFGCWGLGQFRDALSAYAETQTPPTLRKQDEEEDE